MLAKYGVKNALCGHTHTTTNRTPNGLSIFTVAGTARAFDHNGCGYRVLPINATDIESRYVRVDQGNSSINDCSPSSTHPDFEDNPFLSKSWANVSWLL